MKRMLALLCPLIVCVSLAGCSSPKPAGDAASIPPTPAETSGGNPGKPASNALPFDYAAMTDDTYIQLDEEPRIHSPIRTLVAPKNQTFTIFFREPMDRASVEAVLKKNKLEGGAEPAYTFEWLEDRQLLVRASVEPAGNFGPSYQLNLTGAKTKSGRALEKQPEFLAAVEEPSQLWRVSLDGTVREKLTSFEQPYEFRADDLSAGRYLHLQRYQQFCQCDAMYPRLHAIYDLEKKEVVPYPVDLVKAYSGEGTFYADSERSVLYAQPPEGAEVPQSGSASKIHVDGYVFGAMMSRDNGYVLMAVGANKDQESDYDFVIHSLKDGTDDRYPHALRGGVPLNQASGGKLPVWFADDGERVYVLMTKPGTTQPLRYMFNWQTGKISAWDLNPGQSDPWNGFKQSDDGFFTLYTDGSVYSGGQKSFAEMNLYNGIWVPGTHLLAMTDFESGGTDENKRAMIKVFDADSRKYRTVAGHLPTALQIISASSDGKWLYVSSNQSLK